MGKWQNKVHRFVSNYMALDSEPEPRRVDIPVKTVGLSKLIIVRRANA